jgi:uncharacterized protein
MAADPRRRLIVFSKSPRPGTVKTRLIPVLGAVRAASLHAALLDHTLSVANAYAGAEVWLHVTDIDDETVKACAARHKVAIAAQSDGDLGERMHTAFSNAFAVDGCDAVVLVGSDCAVLSPRYVDSAFEALREGHGAVFGPAEDGGYVLVGLTRPACELFDAIAWSTPTVMSDTRHRLRHLGWSWRELEPLWDVDTPEDYARLAREGLTPPGDS